MLLKFDILYTNLIHYTHTTHCTRSIYIWLTCVWISMPTCQIPKLYKEHDHHWYQKLDKEHAWRIWIINNKHQAAKHWPTLHNINFSHRSLILKAADPSYTSYMKFNHYTYNITSPCTQNAGSVAIIIDHRAPKMQKCQFWWYVIPDRVYWRLHQNVCMIWCRIFGIILGKTCMWFTMP